MVGDRHVRNFRSTGWASSDLDIYADNLRANGTGAAAKIEAARHVGLGDGRNDHNY
jgi:hypothetical protein